MIEKTDDRIYAIHRVIVPLKTSPLIERCSELMTLDEANAKLPEWQAKGDGKGYIVSTVWIADNE